MTIGEGSPPFAKGSQGSGVGEANHLRPMPLESVVVVLVWRSDHLSSLGKTDGRARTSLDHPMSVWVRAYVEHGLFGAS